MRDLFVFALLATALPVGAQSPDWSKINDEAMSHFQALVQIDGVEPGPCGWLPAVPGPSGALDGHLDGLNGQMLSIGPCGIGSGLF